jgi:hypothetical protein
LQIQPADQDRPNDPQVLVLSTWCPKFVLAGWMYNREAQLDQYWGEVKEGNGRPCFNVPQDKLRPMSELKNILESMLKSR